MITARVLVDPFGQVLVLQVEDSGPGIPEAERELVFQPFYRPADAVVEGSGLGLAIVREVTGQGVARWIADAQPHAAPAAHGCSPSTLIAVRFQCTSPRPAAILSPCSRCSARAAPQCGIVRAAEPVGAGCGRRAARLAQRRCMPAAAAMAIARPILGQQHHLRVHHQVSSGARRSRSLPIQLYQPLDCSPLVLAGDGDVGGLLGIHLHEEMKIANPVVSIDGLELKDFDYIDIGAMLESSGAVPVVIKSLIFPGGATVQPSAQRTSSVPA